MFGVPGDSHERKWRRGPRAVHDKSDPDAGGSGSASAASVSLELAVCRSELRQQRSQALEQRRWRCKALLPR